MLEQDVPRRWIDETYIHLKNVKSAPFDCVGSEDDIVD